MSVPEENYIYHAKVIDVHDGDTFTALIDLGFWVDIRIKVRIRDVDCPELSVNRRPNPAGVAAAEFVRKLLKPTPYLEENPGITIQSYKDQRSFERWVCDVWLWDSSSLADVLVINGHAVRV